VLLGQTLDNDLQAAVSLHHHDQFKASHAALHRLVDTYPDGDAALIVRAHDFIALNHMRLNEFDEALLAYRQIVKGYPHMSKAVDVRFMIGHVHCI